MMTVGILVGLHKDMEAEFNKIKEYGFTSCQICSWNGDIMNEEYAQIVNDAKEKTGINVSSFWCGLPGPAAWNFTEGPVTIGFVPAEYRYVRVEAIKKGANFAWMCGIPNVVTHAGFIPENPCDQVYREVVACMRPIIRHCKNIGVNFCFETGQETPITLLRIIEDLGGENIGVNLDTGNLILYGKGSPSDAIDVIGPYVMDFHAKDGDYPITGAFLGEEQALGKGKANFPEIIRKMKAIGYDGPITIEREIHGDQQTKDILEAKRILEELINAE